MSISKELEKHIKQIVIDSEYVTGIANKKDENEDFQAVIDAFECERTEKYADWKSDIFIPQFFSLLTTQASTDASQYFATRDFVETYVADGTKSKSADADERLINRTLNQKHLNLFHKYMRLKLINYMKGNCYLRLWWEKKYKPILQEGTRLKKSEEVDIYGNSITESTQTPAVVEEKYNIEGREIIHDRFNFDVVEPRMVITDNNYCYTLQEKEYVIIQSETTLDKLQAEAEAFGYFNLDKLEKTGQTTETDTSKETYNKNANFSKADKTPSKFFDKIERFGKFWVVVKEREDDDYPSKVEPGYDTFGKKKDKAEYIECLITFIRTLSNDVLIGFEPQRCRDAKGNAYRPLIRGVHYIHPTEDSGMGDGRPAKELQIAINDTFNINNDRQMLAAIPVLKMKKYGNEDNTTIRIEPEHVIELEDPDDLQEMRISDNIQGAHIQINFLKGMSEQALALSPSTMGMLPQDSSVTATAIAGADTRANIRSNYKSLTFENTLLNQLYWMISQLTYQYAEPETAISLLGDLVFDFDPNGDYYWKPVSASIETEYSRNTKIKHLTNMLSLLMNSQNPKAAKIVNLITAKIFTLMGDENDVFAKYLLDENAPVTGGTEIEQQGMATSNQEGLPQSELETGAREETMV